MKYFKILLVGLLVVVGMVIFVDMLLNLYIPGLSILAVVVVYLFGCAIEQD